MNFQFLDQFIPIIIQNFLIMQQCIFVIIIAGVQPRLIQGIRSGDSVGEDQDTIASIRY